MNMILWCLCHNIPLGHFDKYNKGEIEGEYRGGLVYASQKEVDTAARKIVGGLSQYKVAEQVAKEWGSFGPGLRMAITDFANQSGHSGNVMKGILYLNQLLGGKILRRAVVVEERVLVERGGQTGAEFRRQRRSVVIGAERAFAAFVLPRDYNNWSPAKKKMYREQMARERRGA